MLSRDMRLQCLSKRKKKCTVLGLRNIAQVQSWPAFVGNFSWNIPCPFMCELVLGCFLATGVELIV